MRRDAAAVVGVADGDQACDVEGFEIEGGGEGGAAFAVGDGDGERGAVHAMQEDGRGFGVVLDADLEGS